MPPSRDSKETKAIKAKANLAKMPKFCYVALNTSNSIAKVKRGQEGYYFVETEERRNFEETQKLRDEMNAAIGVTRGMAEAMETGSMFGYHVPGANPDKYSDEGTYLKKPRNNT